MENLLTMVKRHIPDKRFCGAVQRIVGRGEQLVRAPPRPALGQQRGGQVGIAERQRPVGGHQLHLPPQRLGTGQRGQLDRPG
jgi:hypothetical protein